MHQYKTTLKMIWPIVLITLLPLLAIYLPFALHIHQLAFLDLKGSGMQQIYANWDGPNYVLNAITLYDPQSIGQHAFIARPNEYYAAHFPLYSLLIRPLGMLIGYFPGALIVNIMSNVILNIVFYFWIREKSRYPLWLTCAFTIFPPRYWIVRSVISPEMLLVACLIWSLWSYQKGRYLLAGCLGLLAVTLKFQALILVPTYAILMGLQVMGKIPNFKFQIPNKKSISNIKYQISDSTNLTSIVYRLSSIVLPLLGYVLVAWFYQHQLGDFGAYFKAQEIVGMGATTPFGMFNSAAKWVGTGWLEHTALYFIAMFVLIAKLWDDQEYLYLIFTILYTIMLSLIPQVDIMRLAMPLAPLYIWSFSEFFEQRVFRIGLLLSIPMLYFYVLNFIMTNQAPITNWALFR